MSMCRDMRSEMVLVNADDQLVHCITTNMHFEMSRAHTKNINLFPKWEIRFASECARIADCKVQTFKSSRLSSSKFVLVIRATS